MKDAILSCGLLIAVITVGMMLLHVLTLIKDSLPLQGLP